MSELVNESLSPVQSLVSPQAKPPKGEGLKVILKRIPGKTPASLLKTDFVFQAPPLDEFSQDFAHNHFEWEPISGKQRSRKGSYLLARYDFETLFVDDTPPWSFIQGRPPNPISLSKQLKALCASGEPFRLVIHNAELWGGTAEVDMPVTLRSLRIREKQGESDARYTNVSFVEYRSPDLVKTQAKGKAGTAGKSGTAKKSGASGSAGGSDKTPARVTVGANGSVTISPQQAHPKWGANVNLYDLAKHFYGSNARWTLIRDANGLRAATPSQPLTKVLAEAKFKGALKIPDA